VSTLFLFFRVSTLFLFFRVSTSRIAAANLLTKRLHGHESHDGPCFGRSCVHLQMSVGLSFSLATASPPYQFLAFAA